jgi:hypothetical protein
MSYTAPVRRASRQFLRGYGYGADPISCGPGEEFDWNAMACVTAGQAVTPTPPLPSTVPIPLPKPGPGPAPAPAPQAPAVEPPNYIPWIVGGVAVLGVVLLVATR